MRKLYLLLLTGVLFSINLKAQSLSRNFSLETNEIGLICANNTEFGSSGMSAMLPGKGRIEQRHTGFYGLVNAGGTYAFLNKDEGASLMGIEAIGGYRWSLYSGVGLGVGYYKESGENLHSNIPIFIELRNHFMRDRFSPFTTLSLGYAIPMGRESITQKQQDGVTQGGVVVGFSVGVRYLFTRKIGVNLFAGYSGMKETIERQIITTTEEIVPQEKPYFLHQLKFGLGVSF